jgi:hypothetical protein
MNKSYLIRTLITFVVSYVAFLFLFMEFGEFYVKLFSPVFKAEVECLFSEFKVYSIGYEKYRGQDMIFMQVKTAEIIPLGSKQLPVGYPIVPKTHVVNQYTHPVIIFSILLAWPWVTLRERLRMLGFAVPLLFLLELIDVPLVLVANCQQHINSLYPNPAMAPALPLNYWRDFLMNGGRAVLSILFACLAVAGHYLLRAFRMVEPDRNAPCVCGSGKRYKQCCMPH